MKKRERQKKPIISGHLFLNKEDKQTVKRERERFAKQFFEKGSERQRKQETKRKTTETNNQKDERNDKSKNTQIRD